MIYTSYFGPFDRAGRPNQFKARPATVVDFPYFDEARNRLRKIPFVLVAWCEKTQRAMVRAGRGGRSAWSNFMGRVMTCEEQLEDARKTILRQAARIVELVHQKEVLTNQFNALKDSAAHVADQAAQLRQDYLDMKRERDEWKGRAGRSFRIREAN